MGADPGRVMVADKSPVVGVIVPPNDTAVPLTANDPAAAAELGVAGCHFRFPPLIDSLPLGFRTAPSSCENSRHDTKSVPLVNQAPWSGERVRLNSNSPACHCSTLADRSSCVRIEWPASSGMLILKMDPAVLCPLTACHDCTSEKQSRPVTCWPFRHSAIERVTLRPAEVVPS